MVSIPRRSRSSRQGKANIVVYLEECVSICLSALRITCIALSAISLCSCVIKFANVSKIMNS